MNFQKICESCIDYVESSSSSRRNFCRNMLTRRFFLGSVLGICQIVDSRAAFSLDIGAPPFMRKWNADIIQQMIYGDSIRGDVMTSLKDQVLGFMRCAESARIPAARFFSRGLSREELFKICKDDDISLTNDTIEFFETLNGLNVPPDAIVADTALVMHYSPLNFANASQHFRESIKYAGMPREYFPIFWDHADGYICIVQGKVDSFCEGAVVFWDPVFGAVGRFKSTRDFLKFACISIEQCSLPAGGVDGRCAIVNANKHARMVDETASIFPETE